MANRKNGMGKRLLMEHIGLKRGIHQSQNRCTREDRCIREPHGRLPANKRGSSRRSVSRWSWVALRTGAWLAMAVITLAATQSSKLPVAAKWGRFEHVFTSSTTYSNPLQEVTLTVEFTSPLGEKARVFGFWDGGRTWRVRFAPDQPGRWTFKSTCSHTANAGLNNQRGEFLCTSTIGQSRFRRHGPVKVAQDRHHLEHADGTPFFWLSDDVSNGARLADAKSWGTYAVIRSSQNFTVAEWAVAPGGDGENESALTGFPERIGINPDFFKRLDAKIDILATAGILSAISPLAQSDPSSEAVALPDEQVTLLTRYIVARWGAEPVAWLFTPASSDTETDRWKKIGSEVFSTNQHSPVIVYTRQLEEALPAFAEQTWVDVLGAPLRDVKSEVLAKVAQAHPILALTPEENGFQPKSSARFTAEDVRHAAYCGVLLVNPAGVSYRGLAVRNWETTIDPKQEDIWGAGLPLWHKALFMPGAKQLGRLAELLSSVDFWRLRPDAGLLATPSSGQSNGSSICPAASESKDLSLVYVANQRMLELSLDAMPRSPSVTWFNPRQGGTSPAVAVVVQSKCQFPTPDPQDWVLLIKAGK